MKESKHSHLNILRPMMFCKHSEECNYYKTFRHNSSSKQFQMLAESYCEGALQEKCRRIQYKGEFGKEPPPNLAPNGYLLGTHKKQKTENTRKHTRHKVKSGACFLQKPGSTETFSAWIIDISEGGLMLELKDNLQELHLDSESELLKIFGYTLEDNPAPLANELIRWVWQNNQFIGCSFVPSEV